MSKGDELFKLLAILMLSSYKRDPRTTCPQGPSLSEVVV